MAGPIYADRVKEQSTTTGTGTLNLAGAVAGYQTFVAGVGNGNTCFYCIEAIDGDGIPTGDYEVGSGTVTDAAPDTLSRTTILTSSNGGAAVNFGAGTKNVFQVFPAAAANITGLTAETAVATGDEIAIYDASAGAVRKMTQDNFIPDASQTVKGKIEIAIQSEQETGTSTTLAVAPGVQHYHPSAAKVWAMVTTSGGTPTLAVNRNVTSVDDLGTGQFDLNFTTAFSTANYAVVTMADRTGADASTYCVYYSQLAGSCSYSCRNSSNTNVDPVSMCMVCFGDQ